MGTRISHDPRDVPYGQQQWAPTPAAVRLMELLAAALRDEEVFRAVGLYVSLRVGNVVELRNIGVRAGCGTGAGYGTPALMRLCDLADEAGADLYVQPSPDDAAMLERLRAWYVRHGFDEAVDGDRLIRRARHPEPRPGPASP